MRELLPPFILLNEVNYAMILQYLDTILGSVPSYSQYGQTYEIVRYVIGGSVLLFILVLAYRMILVIFGGLFERMGR